MSRDEKLAEVLAGWQEQLEAGVAPDFEGVVLQHPELREELEEGIEAMQLLDRLLEGGAELAGPTPRKLGEFQILREIGRGGMGVVYEAEQASMRRRVALKALYPRIGRSERAVERFQREARAAGKAHHTNIVPVYGLGREGGVWFYAMELVEGTSLARVLEDMRKLGVLPGGPGADPLTTPSVAPPSGGLTPQTGVGYFHRVAAMFAEVADALEAAHQVGVVHRDVKPSNLILADDGRLKLIDFGLAWMRGEESLVTASGERLGTPLYMSPELARGEKVDARSDIYSLGTTLYEVLALRPPHRGENAHEIVQRILTREAPPLRRVNPRVPRDLETIVHRSLEKEPGRRYATAAAFGRDLRAFAGGEGIRARPVGPVGRLWRRAKRHRVASSLIVAVLVLLALGTGLWIKAARAEAGERALAYRALCAQAEVALARTGEDRSGSELRLAVPSSARELFSQAIALDPGRPEAWLGRALAEGSTPEQRLADLEAAWNRGLGARSYHLARAFCLDTVGREEESAEERRLAAQELEDGALAEFLESRFLVTSGKPEEALPHLDAAIRQASEASLHRYLALMVRSVARRRTGDFEGALEDLSVLRALSGDSHALRVRIASVWRQLGRAERAEESFRAVLEAIARSGDEGAWPGVLDGLSLRTDEDWLDVATARALAAHPRSLELMLRRLESVRRRDAWTEGLDLAERILEIDPESLRALELQALALLGEGRAPEALPVIERAIALAPDEAALHNTRAIALMTLRRFEDAELALREVVRLRPAMALGWSNLAGLLSLMGRHEEGLEAAERLLALDPESASAYAASGMASWGLGRFDDAIAAYERALELGAHSPYDYGHYGMALSDAGRAAEGLAMIDQALALAEKLRASKEPLPPTEAMLADEKALVGIRTGRASALLRLGRNEEALAEAQACLELRPDRPKLWEHHAHALFNLQRYEESRQAAERAMALDPAAHNPRCTLGGALWQLGRLDEARKVLEGSISLDPSCPATYFRLAQVCSASGDLGSAVKYYRFVIEHGSEGNDQALAHTWAQLGVALLTLQRRLEALEAFDTALALDATQDWVELNRGMILGQLGRYDEAVAAFEAGAKSDPTRLDGGHGNPNLRYHFARNLFLAGRIEDALKQHELILPKGQNNAKIHMWHALYLGWLDRFDEATEAYERAAEAPIQPEEARPPAVEFLLLAGQFRRAAALARRAFASDRWAFAVPYLRARRALGECETAADIATGLIEEDGASEQDPLELAWLCAAAGERDRAHAALARIDRPWHPFTAYERARVHALLGESDAALEWIDRARDAGFRWPSHAASDPEFASLAEDPRYQSLLSSMTRTGH